MEPQSDKSPLIVIVGETASGKSALALKLAERFDGEIICADSRTVYKGMDIGTAKPSQEERSRVPHHLLDVVEPDERFSAAQFKRLANKSIENINKRGKLPIMVGGTGLYIDAVLFDYGFARPDAPRDPNNPRHLSPVVFRKRQPIRSNTLIIGLKLEREALRERIAARAEMMLNTGLVDEVQILGERYGWGVPVAQAPAYKAFRGYLQGKLDLNEAKALFIRNDMDLAKRQRTWFKRNKNVHRISNPEEIVDLVTTFLNKK